MRPAILCVWLVVGGTFGALFLMSPTPAGRGIVGAVGALVGFALLASADERGAR